MKKKTYLVILALCAAMAMTACGTSAGQKEETKSTAESQDTADEKDSKAADSAESDSDKESTGTVSGDTRLVSVDDVSKYVTIGQYKGLSLDKTVEAVTDDMVDGRIKEELQNKIATLTGGRAAEEIVTGTISTGASNDIEQATKLARAMITRYGMTEEFDMVAMETVNNQYLGGDTSLACSADTQKKIDEKVVEVVKEQHKKALDILNENKDKLHELANFLYEKETITGEEFMQILES